MHQRLGLKCSWNISQVVIAVKSEQRCTQRTTTDHWGSQDLVKSEKWSYYLLNLLSPIPHLHLQGTRRWGLRVKIPQKEYTTPALGSLLLPASSKYRPWEAANDGLSIRIPETHAIPWMKSQLLGSGSARFRTVLGCSGHCRSQQTGTPILSPLPLLILSLFPSFYSPRFP